MLSQHLEVYTRCDAEHTGTFVAFARETIPDLTKLVHRTSKTKLHGLMQMPSNSR
jgi:hypothetical protein